MAFIEAIDLDPSLRGRISYRSFKGADGVSFYHMTAAEDAGAIAELREKPFFKQYAARMREVAQGGPEFTQMQLIGGTKIQL